MVLRRPAMSPNRKRGYALGAAARTPRAKNRYIPTLEWLEDRTLLSTSPLDLATPLLFDGFQAAHVSHLIASPDQVDLYRVTLDAGDTLDATVRAQTAGSGLASLLRIVNAQGITQALDTHEGADPHVRFQAATTGVYFVGVSSVPNGNYDPTTVGSGVPGDTTGMYTLHAFLTTAAPVMPDLIGGSFQLDASTAVPGDAVPVQFTVENRGAGAAGTFQVEVLLSVSAHFDNSSVVVQSFGPLDLDVDATGRRFFTRADVTVTVPLAQPTGPLFVGLRITADPLAPESNPLDQLILRRGANFDSLRVLTSVPGGVNDLSLADPSLNAGADRTLLSAAQVDEYSFTVTPAQGMGQFRVGVASTSGTLVPRLTLARADGKVLIQSDSGEIVQHLQPGTFLLRVSAQTGNGSYRLSTQFTPTQDPFQPPGVGKRPTVAVADVNGDGFHDLITANYLDDSVSVVLGAGDGTFGAPANFSVDAGPLGVAAGDLNGDGVVDIVTGNYLTSGTVSVLLGRGDGTFQPAQNFTTGDGALFPVIADVNGDGRPDIITGNYRAGTVSVLRGNGDGTFQTQADITVGAYPAFVAVADVNGDSRLDLISPDSGADTLTILLNRGNGSGGDVILEPQPVIPASAFPFAVEAADFNGDGMQDLVSAHRSDDTVRVRLGDGAGSFGPETSFPVGDTPYALVVADFNGDGRPDAAAANRNDGTVSVLLGKGDGTFQPQLNLPVGQRPLTLQAQDVNRDGNPDILAANADDNTVSVLLGAGDGTFSFPASTFAAGKRPFLFVVGDLRGDGHTDIVTANSADGSLSILLGGTAGSFQPNQTLEVGRQPIGVAMADLDRDGDLDLIVTNKQDDTVGVLLGLGDAGFGPQTTFGVGAKPLYVVAEDLNGDNFPDIVVTNNTGTSVSVLLGHGDGGFASQQELPAGATTYGVAVADVNGDGKPDIVASNYGADSVSVLLGNGDGTFQDQQVLDNVGSLPSALALGNINGDGFLDVVVALRGENKVAVLLGNGDGTFGAAQAFDTGGAPTGVALARLNNDLSLDVVVSNRADNSVSVLLGNGDGTLQGHQTFAVGRQPFSVAAVDLSGDGIPDIATANASDSTVSVLLGNGDGTFQAQSPFALAKRPYAVVVADVSGDGNPDSITANYNQGTVSVRRGNGNGSFQAAENFAVGNRPQAVALADLNRDGRADLVTANSADDAVSVLLGNGDGTFQAQQVFAVGQRPSAVAIVDADGDGDADLVVANYYGDSISILLGRGDGTFDPQAASAVGNGPSAVSVADLDADTKPDLAVTNIFGNTVSVLMGNGDGSFAPQETFQVGAQPYDVAIADVDGDGKPDLITANYGGDSVSVLLGNGLGSFGPQQVVLVGQRPVAVALADVNGDQKPDLVSTNRRDGTLSILVNNAGTFTHAQTLGAGAQPVSTAVTNVNGDGRPSIVTVNYSNSTPRVLLASTGSFKPATPGNATESLNNPALVDFTGDGIRDSVILDAAGNVLFRQALPGSDDAFEPPEILNAGRRTRDLTVVNTGATLTVATADSSFDPALSAAANQFVYTVSLYSFFFGSFSRTTAFTSLLLPTRIVAADLTGDGLDDIVVANALDNSIQVSFQQLDHSFSVPITLTTGEAPSNLALVDITGDGLRDIVATDQASGDVSVFLNDNSHSFNASLRYRTGLGRFGLDTTGPAPVIASLQQSVSLAAGDFTGNGRNDLVVVNRGAHSFSVLSNHGRGGFANPAASLTTSTSDGFNVNNEAGAVVAGDFDQDGRLDLAVLMEDSGQLWIYTGTGRGTFAHSFTISVGDQATGLAVVPGETAGMLDLLVGNGFGDVLHLEGKGDGTFQISGKRVSLSVVPDLLGPGQAGVLVGNQQDNRVTVQGQTSGGTEFAPVQTLVGATPSSQLAPGDVQWFKLDRNSTLPDAVVVSSGSNAVVVYRTTGVTNGVPSFAPQPQTYFVGTSPAGVTVADIDGDGDADMLIANRGSNDVSVVFGSFDTDGHWQGSLGPRLKTGGAGPLAVTLRELDGDSVTDLIVTNGGSGTLTMLPGRGQGNFDDRNPTTLFNLGGAVVGPPSFVGDTGLGYAVTAAGEIVRFDLSNFAGGAGVVFSSQYVLAARALITGQVVAVVADGSVKILRSQGDRLNVAAELRAQAGVPALPSSLEVLQKAGGQFEVLVSSQGSDTIFVFASQSGAGVDGPKPGHGGPPEPSTPTQFIGALANGAAASPLGLAVGDAAGAAGFSGSASSSSSAPAGGNAGLSLSSFSSEDPSAGSSATAVLVSLQGNAYSTVAVLDFGSLQDEDDSGGGRLSWLTSSRPLGDTSPLTRLLIGQDEALERYRGVSDANLQDEIHGPLLDPWREDLFHRRLPTPPPPTPGARPAVLQPLPEKEEEPVGCANLHARIPGAEGSADRRANAPGTIEDPFACAGLFEPCGGAADPNLLHVRGESRSGVAAPALLSCVLAGMVLPQLLWSEAPNRAEEEQSEWPATGDRK